MTDNKIKIKHKYYAFYLYICMGNHFEVMDILVFVMEFYILLETIIVIVVCVAIILGLVTGILYGRDIESYW